MFIIYYNFAVQHTHTNSIVCLVSCNLRMVACLLLYPFGASADVLLIFTCVVILLDECSKSHGRICKMAGRQAQPNKKRERERGRHTYIHALHSYIHTFIHAYMYTCIHAFMHTCIHAFMHSCMHAYIHTGTHILSTRYT